MKVINRNHGPRTEKGSALLVSLMVMAGLSLLGLAFVAISETESAIAVNERNYVQAQAAAEAGAKVVIEWFQDAEWAFDRGLLPPNKNAIKTERSNNATGTPYYKSIAGELLFDVPFKIVDNNKFFGNVDTADVIITYDANSVATDFLDDLNAKLFTDDTVRISDIRVYAPPIPGAQLVDGIGDKGFWKPNNKSRYGVATVRVTAQKLANGRVIAQRSVKMVLAETPFPTVDGAIETSGSLVGQGNFHVYWGKILSEQETQVNRPAVGMPWFDANEMMNFEYGYDSTDEWRINTTYAAGALVHAPETAITAEPALEKFSYRTAAGGTTGGTPPDATAWPTTVGQQFTDPSLVTWTTEASRPWRLNTPDDPPVNFYTKYNWLYALLGQTIEDPWLHARARGEITLGNNKTVPCGSTVLPHPCDFLLVNEVVSGRLSNVFQNQTYTEVGTHPDRAEVFFPTMDYEFWKAVAQSGDNQPGNDLYYFKYEEATNQFVGPAGKKKPIEEWLNAEKNGLGAGFYFFDSKNGKNPQYGKGGTLTPGVSINAAVGKPWQMQGYIYLNAENFGTTGQGSLVDDDVFNMPGEPYRDVGYRKADIATNDWALDGGALPAGNFVTRGQGNKIWDWQDFNDNGVFDWHVELNDQPLTRPNGEVLAINTVWLPVPWFPGCKVPDLSKMDAQVAGTCSEPHEPYINVLYPDQAGARNSVTFGWQDPNNLAARRPTKRLSKNTAEVCKSTTPLRDCTSNGYDIDGALVTLAPLLHGALYNEGGYDGSGNAMYYGAVLMRGSFNASGTPEVFFNECLARGCLESQLEMQRVMVTSYETDQ
jgi:hypothetical protein